MPPLLFASAEDKRRSARRQSGQISDTNGLSRVESRSRKYTFLLYPGPSEGRPVDVNEMSAGGNCQAPGLRLSSSSSTQIEYNPARVHIDSTDSASLRHLHTESASLWVLRTPGATTSVTVQIPKLRCICCDTTRRRVEKRLIRRDGIIAEDESVPQGCLHYNVCLN